MSIAVSRARHGGITGIRWFVRPKSARKTPSCWRKANKDKERRSSILSLSIKTDMRAAVTMEAAGCRFYDPAIPYVRI
ncbi:MAG TPA: hypothetical protein PKO23_00495 [Candidatus Hydrogenedentes bacterium]|jgi:hypothetical protein|nr:hypothetical protein [Candidatus Hydrogenedentota bacterium]